MTDWYLVKWRNGDENVHTFPEPLDAATADAIVEMLDASMPHNEHWKEEVENGA